MTPDAPVEPPLFPRCAVCGRPSRPGRRAGTWSHRAGAMASCDLDADHVVRPAESARPGAAPPGGAR
jgi:hypothetical protein